MLDLEAVSASQMIGTTSPGSTLESLTSVLPQGCVRQIASTRHPVCYLLGQGEPGNMILGYPCTGNRGWSDPHSHDRASCQACEAEQEVQFLGSWIKFHLVFNSCILHGTGYLSSTWAHSKHCTCLLIPVAFLLSVAKCYLILQVKNLRSQVTS